MLDQFFFFMNQIVFTSMFGKFNMTSYMYISVNNIIKKKAFNYRPSEPLPSVLVS